MEFKELLEDVLHETGRDLGDKKDEVVLYAAQRSAHLAMILGQPGFALALRAERDNVALKAGLNAVISADRVDNRIVGVIQAGLLMGARVGVVDGNGDGGGA